jgi:formate dehydrogenase
MAKVLCVLYDDPVSGHPKSYARDGVPKVEHYPGGQMTPSPKQIDFSPPSFSAVYPANSGCRVVDERRQSERGARVLPV